MGFYLEIKERFLEKCICNIITHQIIHRINILFPFKTSWSTFDE